MMRMVLLVLLVMVLIMFILLLWLLKMMEWVLNYYKISHNHIGDHAMLKPRGGATVLAADGLPLRGGEELPPLPRLVPLLLLG